MLWPDELELAFIGLVPPEEQVPDSSLAFMLARFAEQLPGPQSWHIVDGKVDLASLEQACQAAGRAQQPALLAGTSLAFSQLCEALGSRRLPLPAGSRAMQTGGFKGRRRRVDPERLRQLIARVFDLPLSHVVTEYGMTELSSQLYEGSLVAALGLGCQGANPNGYYPPPWMRIQAVDPEQLRPVQLEQVGVCQVVDLANVDSAVAILTSDQVRCLPDGSVQLLGRAAGAGPRGCSLAVRP